MLGNLCIIGEKIGMKLKIRIILLVVVPVALVGITALILSAWQINSNVTSESYSGMEASAMAIERIFDYASEGDYKVSGNELWKGDLNISNNIQMIDDIKEETGLDVTVFMGDTRYLTTISDESGKRQVGTKASDEVVQSVIKNGETYCSNKVDIFGERYICVYVPVTQPGGTTPVGMIFVGQRYSNVEDKIERGSQISGIPVILILIISVSIVAYNSNMLVNAIRDGISFLNTLASGKIGRKLPAKYSTRNDEIGEMCRSIQAVDSKLENIVSQLQKQCIILDASSSTCFQTADGVRESVEQISASMQEVASSTMVQAREADDVDKNMGRMGGMIENTTKQVNSMSIEANNMNNASESVKSTLKELSDSMKGVAVSVDEIARQTDQTHKSVQKINEITSIIAGIASQTNLLSLNASIEAARAGENGRGFAVVATEIQKLAEQSNESAMEIRKMLEELQNNSERSVQSMQQIKEIVQVQEDNLIKTNQEFNVLGAGIVKSSMGIKEINNESVSLDQARAQAINLVQNVSVASQDIAAHMEETTASVMNVTSMVGGLKDKAEELADIVKDIQNMVSIFEIEGR